MKIAILLTMLLLSGCTGVYDGITDDNAVANLARECAPGPGCSEIIDALGTCDSLEECEAKVKDMCAPFGGLKPRTTTLTAMQDGAITCMGDCVDGVHVASLTCNP